VRKERKKRALDRGPAHEGGKKRAGRRRLALVSVLGLVGEGYYD